MPKFILKLILFLCPLLLVFIFPLYVYWQGREFMPLSAVLAEQAGPQEALFGFAYDFAERTYKEQMVSTRNPAVIALGTSRVLGFHSSFFAEPGTFINAGNGVKNIGDLTTFVRDLPADNKVSTIILGLDPWWFKPNQTYPLAPEQLTLGQKLKLFFTHNWRTVYADYAKGKFSIGQLQDAASSTEGIGLDALVNQNGFLNDGSHLYGNILSNPNRLAILHDLLQSGHDTMLADRTALEYGTVLDEGSLASLEEFLVLCKEKNIHVAAFITPYPTPLYDAIVEPGDAYAAMEKQLPHVLSPMLASYGFSFFDYTDPRSAGIQEDEFVDNQHTTDKASLRMLILMAQGDATLRKYVDLPALRKLLARTKGDAIMTTLP